MFSTGPAVITSHNGSMATQQHPGIALGGGDELTEGAPPSLKPPRSVVIAAAKGLNGCDQS